MRSHTTALLVACALLPLLRPVAAAQAPQKTVLVLIATRREAPASTVLDSTIRAVLIDGLAGRLDYYTEYLDTSRFPDPEYQRALRDFLRRKYASQTFDVVIATTDGMVDFANTYRDEIFPGAAVVFNALTPRSGPRLTGVVTPFDMKGTIDVALHVHPDLRHVFVISGASSEDRFYATLARTQLKAFDGRLDFTFSSELAMPDLIQRVAALPPYTVIYFVTFFEDVNGAKFVPFEAFNQLMPVANAPIYHWTDIGMGYGQVGGSVLSMETMARATANVALRVLEGESPESIPVREIDATIAQFDWRQLRRWGISESRLPAGSVVRFRQPSLWDQYKFYVVGATGALVLQTMLIAGLLVQRVRRRRVESGLRASEAALRRSNEQNQDLVGRLITAQEDERRRIARDLHDDLNQRLALLSVEMELLGHGGSDVESGARSGRMVAQLRQLSSDVQKLSYQLHPAKLEQLGLVTAARSWCRDLAQLAGVRIDFSAENVPADVPPDISLCLYRIIQESLANVVRHSQASAARVELVRDTEALKLTITDNGQGFDISTAKRGLGLVSMEERMRLLQGRIEVHSSPGQGTRVQATVPLVPAPVAAR